MSSPRLSAIAVRQYRWLPGAPPVDIELGVPREGGRYSHALVLVERDGIPVGLADVPTPDGVVPGRTVEDIAAARIAAGLWSLTGGLAPDPPATRLRVVITTCNNPQRVARAVASVLREPDPELEVVVVENRPRGSSVERVLDDMFPGDERVIYREEPVAGCSRARNCGADGAGDGLVAFLDDDVVAHPFWVTAMRAAMVGDGERPVGVAAGRILPLELETQAQLLFQGFTGFGQDDLPSTFRLDVPPGGNRLFPYAPGIFGSGATMCFPVSAFVALGGFDQRLGTGIPSRGGEDLDVFVRALYLGYSVKYVPQAVIWHEHPSSLARFPQKVYGYGVGLSAMMTKHAVAGPDRRGFARRIPIGLKYLMDPHSRKNSTRPSSFPWRLTAMELLGLLAGPVEFARSAMRERHGAA